MDLCSLNEMCTKEEYIDVEFVEEDVKENEEAETDEEVANGVILKDVFLSNAFLDDNESIQMLIRSPEVPMDCALDDGPATFTHENVAKSSAPLKPAAAKPETDRTMDLTKEEEMKLEAKGYVLPIVRPFTKDIVKELTLMRRKSRNMLASRLTRQKQNDRVKNLELKAQTLPIVNKELRSTIKILEKINKRLLQDKSYLESIIAVENSS